MDNLPIETILQLPCKQFIKWIKYICNFNINKECNKTYIVILKEIIKKYYIPLISKELHIPFAYNYGLNKIDQNGKQYKRYFDDYFESFLFSTETIKNSIS